MPHFIQKKAQGWIGEVEQFGLFSVQQNPSFRDHSLKGKLKGSRAVVLNKSYRLVYRVLENIVTIKIEEVHNHDY